MQLRAVSVLVLVAGLVVTLLPAAAAASPPTVEGPGRVPTASDWATLAWGDALDFSDVHDLRLLPDRTANVANARFADGRFAFDAVGSSLLTFVFPGHAGALPMGRDGARTPIDADRFNHVTLALSAPSSFPVELLWDRCGPQPGQTGEQCRGRHGFIIQPGWHSYTLPLGALTAGQPFAWAGAVTALRLSLGTPAGAHVELDAVRVHEPPAEVTLRWEADQGPLHWQREGPADGSPSTGLVGGGGTAVWPAGAHAPGTYRFVTAGGSPSAPLVVDAAPAPVVDDPDLAGGEDYATAVTGNPWDFAGPDDVLELRNAVDVSYAGGVLAATNGGAAPNDPNFFLRVGAPIDPGRYHRLTVRTRYEGPFSLDDAPGGGAHGRLSWTRADMDQDRVLEGNKVVQSKELVHYPDEDGFTVDLLTDPPSFLMEEDAASRLGWPGSLVTHLRYDVNEDPGPRRWTVDEIALRADDEARGSFDIRWHDVTGEAASVALHYDTDNVGFDGTPIVDGLVQSAGPNSYRWDTTGVTPGSYWVYLVATDGTGTARTYATGPVVVTGGGGTAPPGPGAALRIAGPDRVATAVALSQAAFAGGAPAVVVARDRDFPDALAAAPLAAAAGAPLLLNPSESLAPAVADEISRLGAATVYLMGGNSAQSPAVEAALNARGVRVARVAGPDRYATAVAAAEEAVRLWHAAGDADAGQRVLVARGTDFPDALAAGPLAAHSRQPLLLTGPDVPAATLDALDAFGARVVTVVGGPAVVSEQAASRLADGGRIVIRLAGATRFETAVLAARAAVEAGADDLVVLVASGRAFPDALAAGPAVAGLDGVLLLSERDVVPDVTHAWVAQRAGRLRLLRVAGGSAALADAVADALASAAG